MLVGSRGILIPTYFEHSWHACNFAPLTARIRRVCPSPVLSRDVDHTIRDATHTASKPFRTLEVTLAKSMGWVLGWVFRKIHPKTHHSSQKLITHPKNSLLIPKLIPTQAGTSPTQRKLSKQTDINFSVLFCTLFYFVLILFCTKSFQNFFLCSVLFYFSDSGCERSKIVPLCSGCVPFNTESFIRT